MDENEKRQIAAETATLENIKCEIEGLENVVKYLEQSLTITRELLKGMETERNYLEKKIYGQVGGWTALER